MIVLMLSGAAGSGKTTVATHLTSGKGNWVELSFAAPLKLIAQDILTALFPATGVTRDMFHDTVLKETPIPGVPMTPRAFMQFLGTDVMRARLGRGIWANSVVADVLTHLKTGTHNVVISDLRFPDELDAVRTALAHVPGVTLVVLRIERDATAAGGVAPRLSAGAEHHQSELAMAATPVDHVVHNNADVPALLLAVNQILIASVIKT